MSGRSGDNLGQDISLLLSSFPHLGLNTIQSVLQIHDGDREQAVWTLRVINEELGDEATFREVCLNRSNYPLHSLT